MSRVFGCWLLLGVGVCQCCLIAVSDPCDTTQVPAAVILFYIVRSKMQNRADLTYPFKLDVVSILLPHQGCTLVSLYTLPKKVRMSVVFQRCADRE
eukprot:5472042-Amphidinium_carterae.1